ncbi:hypothetical protein PMKS-003281 [Pichia membranifaciens]|uniref:Uncharacterized protein n=1 Tax=Pichia membranifaciens TaxID=4926 RepID=A0A1Q2YJP7_9ASCO|nr:hypothetical protein PMKS-003281 [Pichia membranifaciens]
MARKCAMRGVGVRFIRPMGRQLYLLSAVQISALEADLLLHVPNKHACYEGVPKKEEAAGDEEPADKDAGLAAEL